MAFSGSEAEIERMVVRIMGDASHYERTLKGSAALTKSWTAAIGKSLTRVGRQMSAMGRSLTLRVTAPIVGMGVASVTAFARFDKAMIESTSIMGDLSSATRDQMRRLALDLSFSGEVLQGPKDLAESYFFLASAGKSAAQSMALLKPVATFATAGAFDMAKATDLLTDAQSALGMTSKDVVEDEKNLVAIGDVLVKANTLANASVEQFATALTTKAGSSFKAYNIELEQGVALLAAYADQGIKAELAGNAADRMIRLLTKATADNAKEFERLGIEVFDTSGEFNTFSDIIGDIEYALEGMSTQQKTATLSALGFEARVQQVILPLLGTSDALKKYADDLKLAGGITEEVAEKQMKSLSAQMKKMWNQITVVAIGIGQQLIPAVTWLNEKISTGVKWWNQLNDSTKDWILIGAGIAAAVGPALVIIGGLLTTIGLSATGISVIGGILASSWPIILAIGVAAASAVTTFLLWGEAIKDFLAPHIEHIARTIQRQLMPAIQEILPVIADLWATFMDLAREVGPLLLDLFEKKLVFAVKVFVQWLWGVASAMKEIAKVMKELGIGVNFGQTQADRFAVPSAARQSKIDKETEAARASYLENVAGPGIIDKYFANREEELIGSTTPNWIKDLERQILAEQRGKEEQRVIDTFFQGQTGARRNTDAQQAEVDAFFGGGVAPTQAALDRTVQAGGVQAAAFGGAEAMGRIAAFRSTGVDASPQERAADSLVSIQEALTTDGIVIKDPGLTGAGLSA